MCRTFPFAFNVKARRVCASRSHRTRTLRQPIGMWPPNSWPICFPPSLLPTTHFLSSLYIFYFVICQYIYVYWHILLHFNGNIQNCYNRSKGLGLSLPGSGAFPDVTSRPDRPIDRPHTPPTPFLRDIDFHHRDSCCAPLPRRAVYLFRRKRTSTVGLSRPHSQLNLGPLFVAYLFP